VGGVKWTPEYTTNKPTNTKDKDRNKYYKAYILWRMNYFDNKFSIYISFPRIRLKVQLIGGLKMHQQGFIQKTKAPSWLRCSLFI
jgi:hypothetical protein